MWCGISDEKGFPSFRTTPGRLKGKLQTTVAALQFAWTAAQNQGSLLRVQTEWNRNTYNLNRQNNYQREWTDRQSSSPGGSHNLLVTEQQNRTRAQLTSPKPDMGVSGSESWRRKPVLLCTGWIIRVRWCITMIVPSWGLRREVVTAGDLVIRVRFLGCRWRTPRIGFVLLER